VVALASCVASVVGGPTCNFTTPGTDCQNELDRHLDFAASQFLSGDLGVRREGPRRRLELLAHAGDAARRLSRNTGHPP
jgi:hypothetical protein